MKRFKADLHIHTCLSPCADLDMSPRAIVEKSIEKGLDIIAVCDHNAAENVGATMRKGAAHGLQVLPGMEINSREEAHILALFKTADQALNMQEIIYRKLKGTNRPELFGDQVIANEFDEVEGFNDHLLIGAVDMELKEIIQAIHNIGGLSIASHVDRPSFSVLSQLGFIPSDLGLDALEIANPEKPLEIPYMPDKTEKLPILKSSDAHFLSDVGRKFTNFLLEEASLEEIRMALSGVSGRKVEE
jgi:PHP family Zn ribbon phosphoesterase